MKLANKAYFYVLTLLILAFALPALGQTPNGISAKDPRNTAPTVGGGGPVGGPTGLFTVYDGKTLRRGEYTFSLGISNFDRDPGNVDITEVPLSFQIGVTNNLELFFNTDGYRGVKVNSPRNLSSFYLPNSQINGISPAAIVLAPQGPGTSVYAGQGIYRPASTGFVQFPYIGGSAGNFGFPGGVNVGALFGFPTGGALLGPPRPGGKGADEFPGIGSPYGSILPGVVLSTTTILGPPNNFTITAPVSYAAAPSYLPDAPFINRTYGESSFSTLTGGLKWRFTKPENPIGVGIVAYYKYYWDHADDFQGFNQLQRGASPGGSRGDIGVTLFADSRVTKWFNLSGNLGYNYNSDVKGDFSTGKFILLDRPDELMGSVGADFPVNRYFQPILELRATRYVAGHTPNAFPQNPVDGIFGARIYPARWISLGAAYRYNFNEQDSGYWGDNQYTENVTIPCATFTGGEVPVCVPRTQTTTFTGVPAGFTTSSDPHGFIGQVTIGRRDKRIDAIPNQPANVDSVTLSDSEISLGCPPGYKSASGGCNDSTVINVATKATDPENDVLTYNYTVSGGRIIGTGANVQWDLTGVSKGTYTITAGVDDGCGICGKTQTQTVSVVDCPDCKIICDCAVISVSGPAGLTDPGQTITFTANVSGGSGAAYTYNWTVSAGTIESGQGTPVITVSTTKEMANSSVTATVDVGGQAVDCNCDHTKSETASIAALPTAPKIDEFGAAKDDDVKARIDALYTQLGNNPQSQGYIINYGTPAEIKKREAQIIKAINFRKYDKSRVTLVQGPDHGTGIQTDVYLVPPGADNPQP